MNEKDNIMEGLAVTGFVFGLIAFVGAEKLTETLKERHLKEKLQITKLQGKVIKYCKIFCYQ